MGIVKECKSRDELMDALIKAGNKYDGHVTHGSITAQMVIVDELLRSASKCCCPAANSAATEIRGETLMYHDY